MLHFSLLFTALLLAACVKVDVLRYDAPVYSAVPATEVRFLETRPGECVALAQMSLKTGDKLGTVRRKFEEKAASLGANAVVVEAAGESVGAVVPIGGILLPISETRYSALALRCP